MVSLSSRVPRVMGWLLLLLFLVGLVSCARPTPAQEKVLRARLYFTDIKQLDPIQIGSAAEHFVAVNIYSNLVRYRTGSGEIEPDLAERWDVSEDGLVYTFYLRRGVKWHKGYGEFTAEDVKFTIERHQDPNVGSLFATHYADVSRVDALDKYTVRIILSRPNVAFLTSVLPYRGGFIVSKKAVTELGAKHATNPVGTGPFVFEGWTPGQELVLSANPDYYRGRPKLDKVVFKVITDEEAAAAALESQAVDIIWTQGAEQYRRLKNDSRFVVKETASTTQWNLAFNTTRKPFTDKRVRQALQYAVDKETWATKLLGGTHLPATSYLPPVTWGYAHDVKQYPYDPNKAKQLLAEAGYRDGFTVELLYSSLKPQPALAEAIQASFREAGVTVKLKGLDHGTYNAVWRKGEYDMVLFGLGRPPDPDANCRDNLHSSAVPPKYNLSYYSSADQLIEAGRTERDPVKRREIYRAIQQLVADDSPVIPLVNFKTIAVMWPYVVGYVPGILNDFDAFPVDLTK